ncbi:MAG: hypothetical protein Q9193_005341 [Seirophora villosa]
MADPISFVASVVAVSTLAGNVVTKGYRYIKAVKDCPDEVRRLMAEVNVLYGILNRLTILLRGNRPATAAWKDASSLGEVDSGHSATDSSPESENGADTYTDDLGPPDFITYECRKTLEEIQNILNTFAHSEPRNAGRTSRFSISSLRRLDPKDLKWPLSSSKTMRLIEALERHKGTCTLALAGDGLVGIHAVLNQTKLSNQYLAEIQSNQETMLELQLSQEQGKFSISISYPSPGARKK